MANSSSGDSIFGSSSSGASSNPSEDSIFDNRSYAGPAFDADDIGAWLAEAPAAMLHEAPFGIIEVDADGIVLFYNDTEADFSGVPRDEAEGESFFFEIAPCTDSRTFRGRLEEHADADTFDLRFSYTFTYRMSPTLVDIRLVRHSGRTWILVRPEGSTFLGVDGAEP